LSSFFHYVVGDSWWSNEDVNGISVEHRPKKSIMKRVADFSAIAIGKRGACQGQRVADRQRSGEAGNAEERCFPRVA
jgi:hypothetical protein